MRRLLLLTLAVVPAAACTDVITEPGVPVAIEARPLPFPALLVGDSLRDTLGVARPLHARLFDGRGELVEEPGMLSFIVVGADSAAQLDASTGHLVGVRPGEIRVVIAAGGLQTAPIAIPVVPRPTALEAVSALRDTIPYLDFRDHLHDVEVRLVADTGAPPPAPVRRYLVDFRIVEPPGLPVDDSTRVLLVNEQRRPSIRDTTGADGRAMRRVRLSPWIERPPPDSVVVEVRARHLDGTAIAGSPMEFVIHVVPAP